MNRLRACLASVILILLASCAAKQKEDRMGISNTPGADVRQTDSRGSRSGTVERIKPRDAKRRIDSGAALLVCAYDTPEKFRRNHLQGALSLDQLQSREASLAKEQEIIFYCA